MSLLFKGGISKLSELEIDADKDWRGRGISNIREVVAGMAAGDMVQHDGARLARFRPGTPDYVATSEGQAKLVVWAPGGTYFERYFPVSVGLLKALGLVAPSALARAASVGSGLSYPGATGQPSVGLSRSAGVATVDRSVSRAASAGRQLASELDHLMGGAVADDGGARTDQTAAANNDTASDMTLLPAVPASNDAYYFGDDIAFPKLRLNQGTNGAGTWTIVWEYWNGAAWVALPGVADESNGFRGGTGTKYVSWTLPGDWALTTVQGLNLYWVRARVSSYTSVTTQPKGTRSWTVTAI